MKRNHIALALVMTCMIAMLPGCTKEAGTPIAASYQKEAVYPEGIEADDYEKKRENQEAKELNAEVIESLADFTYETTSTIQSKK